MTNGNHNSKSDLNELQARRLRVTCQHIDGLLADMETVLHSSESKSVFPRYVPELSPAQRKTIEDYSARLRAQLLRVLDSQGISPEPPRITEAHALYVSLAFIEIALAELTPDDMKGYGSVAPEAASDLTRIVQELSVTVAEMHSYLIRHGRDDQRAGSGGLSID